LFFRHLSLVAGLLEKLNQESRSGPIGGSLLTGPVVRSLKNDRSEQMANDKRRVLVVDDNVELRRILRAALERAGYEVLEAESGEAAVRSARVNPPHLILLDLSLPDMEGTTAARVLKSLPQTAQTPIVGCSAHFASEWREKALRSGMVEYLQKPIGLQEIEAVIRQSIADD
jgi:CheY-like chemotaxis protein